MDYVIVDVTGVRTAHPPFRAAENAWETADRLNNAFDRGFSGLSVRNSPYASQRGPFTVEIQNSPADELPRVED